MKHYLEKKNIYIPQRFNPKIKNHEKNGSIVNFISKIVRFFNGQRIKVHKIVEKIMYHMEPDDLASFSLTNKKYKTLARDHFKEKRKCGEVTIYVDGEAINFDLKNQPMYIKCFKNLIRSVRFEFFEKSPRDVAQFINENCHRLKFQNWYRRDTLISETFDLLKHCNHLEHLVLVGIESDSKKWMNRNYPHLERLVFRTWDGTPIDEIFFQNNPQLKCVYLNQNNGSSLLLTETILPYAVVSFASEGESLENQSALEISCQRRCIKSLELVGSVNVLRTVMPYKYIEAFHCFINSSMQEYFHELILARDYHPNIKPLCLTFHFGFPIHRIIEYVATLFPNLIDLSIIFKESRLNEKGFSKCLTPIFRKLLSLSDIHLHLNIYDKEHTIPEKKLLALASVRSTLSNASPVTIHLSSECEFVPWPVGNNLVAINIEKHGGCAICYNFSNPSEIEEHMAKVMETLEP